MPGVPGFRACNYDGGMMKRVLPILLLVFAAGCGPKDTKPLAPFNAADYEPFAIAGTATVGGSAFLITKGGDIKKAAGRKVLLIPETPYLRARLNEADTKYPAADWLEWSDDSPETIGQAWRYTKMVVADVDGKFAFNKVPAGRYILETQLFWQYMSCGFIRCSLTDTGAVLRKHIVVAEGSDTNEVLTLAIER